MRAMPQTGDRCSQNAWWDLILERPPRDGGSVWIVVRSEKRSPTVAVYLAGSTYDLVWLHSAQRNVYFSMLGFIGCGAIHANTIPLLHFGQGAVVAGPAASIAMFVCVIEHTPSYRMPNGR